MTHQFVIIATLASEEAAEKFLSILVRKGTALCPLTQRDPIVTGASSALVVTSLYTSDSDATVINRFVRLCIASVPWHSLVVLPAENLGSLQWTCRGSGRDTPSTNETPTPEEAFNEDAWFAEGESLVHEEAEAV